MMSNAMSAAAVGGLGAQTLWNYNRENYMFEIPLRQARLFQEQNIALSRFALFREDIRDLSALTLDKVESYLIVNTLKLGFIVTVFFNFDRTDTEITELNPAEEQINCLTTLIFCTSFFWLITSIWFSMHAVILAQSLMTKMLVQVVRIPMPSTRDITSAASDATHFEKNLQTAFRVPFLSRSDMGPGGHAQRTNVSQDQFPSVLARPPGAAPTFNDNNNRTVSIVDAINQNMSFTLGDPARGALEPHVKLFKLIRQNWTPYDLYGKISMELGTTTFLSGLGYYSLYYMRLAGYRFEVQPGGWCTFVFMTVLAWFSLVLDLTMPKWGHTLLFILIMSGPAILLIQYRVANSAHEWIGSLSIAFTLHACWVLLLCWSSVGRKDAWPVWWRASRFLNVLHYERGPAKTYQDLQPSDCHQTMDSDSEDGSDSELSPLSPPLSIAAEKLQAVRNGSLILQGLDAILETANLPQGVRRATRRIRDQLYEACQAMGTPMLNGETKVGGFWLKFIWKERGIQWISPNFADAPPVPDAASVALDDVLIAARNASMTLFEDSHDWTRQDMLRLATYGGEAVRGVQGFAAQFRKSGSGSGHPIGWGARKVFNCGVFIITVFWTIGCCWSWHLTATRKGQLPQMRYTLGGSNSKRLDLVVPRWLSPSPLSCRQDWLVLAGTEGAFAMQQSSANNSVPLDSCGDSDIVGADFGPRGELWIVCKGGQVHRTNWPPGQGGTTEESASTSNMFIRAFESMSALAMDSDVPTTSALHGVALRGDRISGLMYHPSTGLSLVGAVAPPSGAETWIEVSLFKGQLTLLSSRGTVRTQNTTTGGWSRPVVLPSELRWKGICQQPGSGLLALGFRADHETGGMELWQFT